MIGSTDLMKDDTRSEDTRPGGSPGSLSGARPRRRTRRRASGGRACHRARPGPARKGNMGNTSASPSRGPTTYGKQRWGRVRCQKGGSESGGSGRTRPGRQKLALGTWNVTSLGGKELCEVSVTSWIWLGSPLRTASALEPYFWIGVGHYSSPELLKV
ncbi:hypothetical protein CgunFtcFv8_002033 [Champsocephalus gunnari]|uniref:Uncharacterized protein n=1 Tax=Champsocephalus gunnari TaxID=52237 RepID=A0AAN8H8M9_CHAGU|nr:hypothetical protein CgunFtcFv8_002033 [Champsocephalus gunnari]